MNARSIIFRNLLFALASILTLVACQGNKDASDVSAIPDLYERQGELATADEWLRTKEKVAELKEAIAAKPEDTKPRLQIAAIYLSEARITGEHPYYYPAVIQVLDGVLALDPQNFEATTYKASVKMSQHQFAEALVLAEKARTINPNNAYVYGVLVDANVELGNYEEAVKMSDIMQQMKPSLESYARASYLREIYGDYSGSIEAMRLAVQAGLPGSEPQCWTKNTLGHLYELTGQSEMAKKEYQEVLAMRPSYAFALGGIAKVYKNNKEYGKALAELEKAVAIMPEYSFHEEMADIYALRGETERAKKKYIEVLAMLEEDAQSGHRVDLELCKLYTKAGQLDSALVYGLKEYAVRPKNIDVNHALAHVYLNEKTFLKAEEHIKLAMVTGSMDPDLLQTAKAVQVALGKAPEASKFLSVAIQP